MKYTSGHIKNPQGAVPMDAHLKITVDEQVVTFAFDWPEKRNAFNLATVRELVAGLRDYARNDDVRAVVLTGTGNAFCSGGDLGRLGREAENGPRAVKDEIWDEVGALPKAFAEFDKPVIAALNGVAAGAGLDIALMCDLRVASDQARLGETYARVGLIPGGGGTWLLPRTVGPAKALEMLWLGDMISAEEALRIGLVNAVYPAESFAQQVHALAQRLARGPTLSLRLIKRAVYQGLRTDLTTALDMVSSHMTVVRQSDDYYSAIEAFQAKKPPKFVGR